MATPTPAAAPAAAAPRTLTQAEKDAAEVKAWIDMSTEERMAAYPDTDGICPLFVAKPGVYPVRGGKGFVNSNGVPCTFDGRPLNGEDENPLLARIAELEAALAEAKGSASESPTP